MSIVIDAIEGPSGAAVQWSSIDWSHVRHHVSRLQTRIVKAVERRVLHSAFSRLEPSAVKVACSVLRGRDGGNVTPLPDPGTGWDYSGFPCPRIFEAMLRAFLYAPGILVEP